MDPIVGIITIGSGIICGGILGYTLQRGGFCMNTAFRSIVFDKDHSILRAWILALVINMVAVQALDFFAVITITRAPFYWPALIVGGFVFGVGMVLAGGCTSGTWYRCGRGMLGSLFALFGFIGGATIFIVGPLGAITTALRRPIIDAAGEELTLYNIIPWNIDPLITQWVITGVLVAAGIVWLVRAPKSRFVLGWGWVKTGLVVGVLGIAAWLFSSIAEPPRNYGLSFTQPTVSLVRYLFSNDTGGISWATWLVVGVPLGAAIAAIISKEFRLRMSEPSRAVTQFFGGLLMGAGASIAGGCNIGHGITGISVLSVASITATIFTMGGVWATTWFVYRQVSTSLQPTG